jgi:hypothetical protein
MKTREESCGVSQSISVFFFFFVKTKKRFFEMKATFRARKVALEYPPHKPSPGKEVDDLRAQKWPTEQTPIFTRKNKNERW